MARERFLVTGATGCIGSWVVKNLLTQDALASILDYGDSRHRLHLILSKDELAQLDFIPGDVTDLRSIKRALEISRASYVIHLAALQLPFCRDDPPLGGYVNVVGTANIFEASKQANVEKVVFASSIAVYGPAEEYPEGPLSHDAILRPRSLYGIFKHANEQTGLIYWKDYGLPSIGLRPSSIYGPGRDQGLTSGPTKAMMAALADRPYTISFTGQYGFQFADDVARIFIDSCRASFRGADTFNIGGPSTCTDAVIAEIEKNAPVQKARINHDTAILPFPYEFDNSSLRSILGELRFTPLDLGIAESMRIFKEAISNGLVSSEYIDAQCAA
jgi:UDP-glucuronate 4-epimerase